MKNKFIISEEEKNRILGLHETAKSNPGTVLSEQALGVAFGPEMNGLKIKKVEATEQTAKKATTQQPEVTPQMMGVTPIVKSAMDLINDKFSKGAKVAAVVVPQDPKGVYVAIGTPADDGSGQMSYNLIQRFTPIIGNKVPLPYFVITQQINRGYNKDYTRRDGTTSSHPTWEVTASTDTGTRAQNMNDVAENLQTLTNYGLSLDDLKKVGLALVNDPKYKAQLPAIKQYVASNPNTPDIYKQMFSQA